MGLTDMQVNELSAEGLKRAYSVTVPAADLGAARDKRLGALAKDLRLPGFRPGKVPMSVVKGRYGTAVMGEVLEERVQEATRQIVTDRGIRPALQPKVEVVTFDDHSDLEFRIDVEVLPEIPMPDFSGIEVTRPRAEPSDEEIAKALQGLANRNAKMEDVTEDRPAAKGDFVVADFTGRLIEGEGAEAKAAEEPFPGGSATDMPIEVGGSGFIPGFTEGLEGIRVGETRKVPVTFPEGYANGALAGKPAEFEVTAKGLKTRTEAPVDEEFAKSLGLDSLEKLREELKASIQREYDGLTRLKVKRALLDQLSQRADFPVPEGMVQAEFDQIWQRVEADMKAGRLDADDAGKDEDTLKAEYRGIAERRIRLGLLLSEIGRTNNIQVPQDEIAQAMRNEAARYQGQEKQVLEFFQKNPQAIENLRAPLFEEKVVDFMLELAKVTDTTVTPGELQPA